MTLTKILFFALLFLLQATGSIPQHAGQYHSHAAVLQNASLAELGGQPGQPPYYAGAPNLGSAVSSSMHLTNSTSETDAGATGYKMEHEMMYYSVSLIFDFVIIT